MLASGRMTQQPLLLPKHRAALYSKPVKALKVALQAREDSGTQKAEGKSARVYLTFT